MIRHAGVTAAVVAFATFVGLGIRLAVVATSPFPLNDGGLFYTMITDLVSNRLALPAFSSYNSVAVPYAYPPLGLYFYAILSLTTRFSLLQLVQYGPPILSAASIPAFYVLAQAIVKSKPQAAMATLVFALLPRAFDWLMMGGGVTRTFGMLFALLAMHQAFLVFSTRSNRALVLLIVFGSLVVYAHPEAATHTAVTAILFYLWQDRSRKGLIAGLLAAGGVLLLTAPWWGVVVARHGLDPFLAAAAAAKQDSYNVLVGLFALFRFDFADEPFVTILTVLGLIGIAVQLARRQYLLPLWLLAMHSVEPRGGTLFMTIPLSILGGIALDVAILPTLNGNAATTTRGASAPPYVASNWLEGALRGTSARLAVGFVIVYGMMSAYATGLRIREEFTLGASDLQAMAWVRTNTAADARFAIITAGLPLRDATSEWFPTLTGRQSIGTVFGFEWIRDVDFGDRVESYQSLQACAAQTTSCLQAWTRQHSLTFEYVYLRVPGGADAVPLGVLLDASSDYETVYAGQTLKIYRWKGAGLALAPATDSN